ncbi:reverse transcriptase domain-containing protein [Tanacetum coccineum]
MAQLLEAPTEGYEDAIVIPEITANNFEIKHGLLNLVQNKQFFGNDKEDPHAHIRYFNKITSTMKIPNVPNTSVKLMLFPFSLEGAARIWLEKEPPRSIETWDDLVSKFINKFFPPSKTTNLRNEITRFQQKFDETFYEAWDRFNDLLRGCPHHGFSECMMYMISMHNVIFTTKQKRKDLKLKVTPPDALATHSAWVKTLKEITGLMLMTMDLEIQKTLEHLGAFDMLKELKTLYVQQANHELLQTVREFHACKQEKGLSVSSYVLKMKSYIDNLERLDHAMT